MRTSRWLIIFYSAVLFFGVLISLPNLFSKDFMQKHLPWLPDTRVTLGLDLKGGSSLVLEVDRDAVKKEAIHTQLQKIQNALQKANIVATAVINNDKIIVESKNSKDAAVVSSILNSLIEKIQVGRFRSADNIAISRNNNQFFVTFSEDAIKGRVDKAVEQSVEIIRRRVDEVGVAEPSIQKIGSERIMVQLPGLQDPRHLRALLGKTAKLTFHFVETGTDLKNPPLGVSVLQGYQNAGRKYAVKDLIALDGKTLTDARAFTDINVPGGQVKILFRLNGEGAEIFREITEKNIGKPFAIVLDNKVLTAPVIQSVIPNGSGEITGNFTVEEATQLSALLRAGALPAPLTVVDERSVGPDLGADAVKKGIYAGAAGFLLVAIFMIFLYGVWGLIADIALALHTVLTFSALSLLGATLTLPGIAGIILGIGVAVDANILINERIKEETQKGLSAVAALERGFAQAFRTIVDANVTGIIATALLYWQGTGAVRGFAVTMFLGIVISMFTEVTLVRVLMAAALNKFNIKTFSMRNFSAWLSAQPKIQFMKARFVGLALSLILSLASIFLFFKPGLNYGIDFKGGIQIQMTTLQKPDLDKLRSHLNQLQLGDVSLQGVANSNTLMIRVPRQGDSEKAQTLAADKVRTEIQKIYPKVNFSSTEIIGPKISSELARSGFIAVVLATLAMTIYIWVRFEWFFAVGAMVTLVLDITKMVGCFALFQFDFTLTAIAALLTILGYSINDKVVVYDRMRENLKLYRHMPLRELIDMSINQVFVRCLFTAAATILAMLPIALWGGMALHSFSIPVIIGIIIATSSSIFIAAPILLFLGQYARDHQKNVKKQNK